MAGTTTTESRELFSRCNISEDVIRRITRKSTNEGTHKDITLNNNNNINKDSQSFTRTKRLQVPAISVSHSNRKNRASLERLLLSVPLDDVVARFSDNESASSVRSLPLYSDNYESFCLPSSGYKSDSEGRGRSKYRIRTCNSANPSPNQSPERPAEKASVRRTRSLNNQQNERVNEIRQRLRNSQRKESLEACKKANNSALDKLKQLGLNGFNTESKLTETQKSSLQLSSVKPILKSEKDETSTSRTPSKNALGRAHSFNAFDNKDIQTRYNKSEKQNTSKSAIQQSSKSAFDKVREHFFAEKWRERSNNQIISSENPSKVRSNSFSSLHDVWESKKAFQKDISGSRKTNQESDFSQQEQPRKSSFSDVENNDIVNRRRERRRLKRLQLSDRSDSETETEDSHLQRQALERLQRRTRILSTSRRPRQRHFSDSTDDNNDENNNETASDKTLDSGIFELAVSSISKNINKLSNQYSNNEEINTDFGDCLSPKSGYSSASESLAESLAESTTTFCDSNDEATAGELDRRRHINNRFKFRSDQPNMKTAVLNSTRVKNFNIISHPAASNDSTSNSKQILSNQNRTDTMKTSKQKPPVRNPPSTKNSNTNVSEAATSNKAKKTANPTVEISNLHEEKLSKSTIENKQPQLTSEKKPLPSRDQEEQPLKLEINKSKENANLKTPKVKQEIDKKPVKEKPFKQNESKKEKRDENDKVDGNPKNVEYKTTINTLETKNEPANLPPRPILKTTTSPKNGIVKPERKISHHNCFQPIDMQAKENTRKTSNSPAPNKTRRVSHQGCLSSDSEASRSNTPTKTRRVSHIGCFSSAEKSSDSENSRSNTPTKHQRVSQHNCLKSGSERSSDSENSRSNTPTRPHRTDNLSITANKKTKERKISHHNCSTTTVEENHTENLSSKQQEQLNKTSKKKQKTNNSNNNTDEQSNKKVNEPSDHIMLNSNTNNKIQNTASSTKAKKTKENNKVKHSPTSNQKVNIEINPTTTTTIPGTKQLKPINESALYEESHNDTKKQDHKHLIKLKNQTNSCDDNINKDISDDKHNSRTKKQTNQPKLTSIDSPINTTPQKSLKKFKLEQASLCEQSNRSSLIQEGDTVELLLNLDPKQKKIYKAKAPVPSPKPTRPSTNEQNSSLSQVDEKVYQNRVEKATQCLLLTADSKQSTKIVSVNDTAKQINQELIQQDILSDIQFTFPQYLISPQQLKEIKQQQQEKDETSDSDLDETNSSNTNSTTKAEQRLKKEKLKSKKLEMENARLQQLLYEIEKARAGTMKALLHVNTMLNKTQDNNTQLEADLQVCGQEKKILEESLKEYTDKELSSIDNIGAGGKRSSGQLSIVVEQWKKEKKELLSQLNKFKGKSEEGEKASTKLQTQYKKVKEQLEHSNNAFTMTLKNNLEATKRMEDELKHSLDEKKELYKKVNEGNKFKRDIEMLKNEMEEIKATNEELQDENENLDKKVKHLEKQKKQLQREEEELHEQIAHSQEIIEKLTDVEEELRQQLDAEIKDKEYMQECLDETGHILYQLRNNERKLINDKDTLLDDLEAELEEKQTLQTTLDLTMDEHKEIVGRLQDMTNIHTTVKESLQQANKKEKNYQEQIEALTKTKHILHYTLEKEKEERMDLQEMFDIIESDHKKFKNETLGRIRDMESNIERLNYENHQLKEMKDVLEKKCEELQATLEHEEEENDDLRQRLTRAEQLKESINKQLETLHDSSEQIEQSKSDLQKHCHELEADLKVSKQKMDKLTNNLEESEYHLNKSTKELQEAKLRLEEYGNDYDNLQSKNRERMKRIRELEGNNEALSEQKDRYLNRMNYYENETKELRKKVNEQTQEIGTLKIESQRFARERDTHKRNCEMSVHDFEVHKAKCTETLKKLKDEIIELSNKIVEKDRSAMRQKEQMENTQNDLQVLRSTLDSNIKSDIQKIRKISEASDSSGSEKLDLGVLRSSHDKFRDEFQSHVDKLEDMLKDSKEYSDTVTVVQSPMSKIKLEELKQLRNEMFEMQSELTSIKNKFATISAEVTSLKLGTTPTKYTSKGNSDDRLVELEEELSKVNELVTRIEFRHKAVMSRNAILLQRTLTDDDRTAKDLVKKFQVISLEGENKQLKTVLGILKKKYDFNEKELANELKKIGDDRYMNGNNNNNTDYPLDDGNNVKPLRETSTLQRSLSSRRPRQFNFLNDTTQIDTPVLSFTRELNMRSNGVSSCSDDDEYTPTTRLPKRNNTLPSRSRRQ